jgi:hypothetical protein
VDSPVGAVPGGSRYRRWGAAGDRIGDLIGLLDRITAKRRKTLLAVPGAAALLVAQPRHDREQPVEGPSQGTSGLRRFFRNKR